LLGSSLHKQLLTFNIAIADKMAAAKDDSFGFGIYTSFYIEKFLLSIYKDGKIAKIVAKFFKKNERGARY